MLPVFIRIYGNNTWNSQFLLTVIYCMKFYKELKSRLETCEIMNYKIFTQVPGGLALLDSEKAEVLAAQS